MGDVPVHLFRPASLPTAHLPRHERRVRPVALNEGERDFIADLKNFYEKEHVFFEGKELYLLRNLSRGRGIGFFEAGNFYPDFILWLLLGGKQYVSFVDPKGIRNLDGADDPKISFFQTVKQLEQRLADPNVVLNSFIIANTRYEQVDHWLTPGTGQRMSKADFEKRNVLFQNEDKATYIGKLLEKTIQQRQPGRF